MTAIPVAGFTVAAGSGGPAHRRDHLVELLHAARRQALSRTGEPDDIAAAVAFLASSAAAFITGQTILVDGGEARN